METESEPQPKLGLPTWTRLAFGFALAAAVLWLSFWMASEVYEGETMAFDLAVRNGVHEFATPWLTRFFIAVSFLASPLFLVILGLAIVGVFAYMRWRRAIVLFLITMTGEILLDLLLKGLYARIRPEPFFDYTLPASFSFPSGHALGSFCFFGVIAWLVSRRLESKLAAWSVRVTTAIFVLLVGTSRVYLGVHYPTDILAGYVTGAIWLTTVLISAHLIAPRRTEARRIAPI